MRYANTYSIPQDIVNEVWEMTKDKGNIGDLPIEKIESVIEKFKKYLVTISAIHVLDYSDGMVCFKFEPANDIPLDGEILLSTAMFHLVNASLYKPAPEPKNLLPYTTFKSSAQNPEKMKEAGVKFYTPDEKLGYHNDVFYKDGKYSIPKYVSLINLFIGYDAPGNFYYINKNQWQKFKDLFSRGIGKKFKFRPTPIVYESHIEKGMAKSPMDEWVDVPVFWKGEDKEEYAFSNEDTTLISELKESLLNNSDKLAIPQKTKQIMVFRNDIGFHSRDIFKEQIIFEGVTRLFLRAVSEESIKIPA
jgi:hypothetical protein